MVLLNTGIRATKWRGCGELAIESGKKWRWAIFCTSSILVVGLVVG